MDTSKTAAITKTPASFQKIKGAFNLMRVLLFLLLIRHSGTVMVHHALKFKAFVKDAHSDKSVSRCCVHVAG